MHDSKQKSGARLLTSTVLNQMQENHTNGCYDLARAQPLRNITGESMCISRMFGEVHDPNRNVLSKKLLKAKKPNMCKIKFQFLFFYYSIKISHLFYFK